jgi:hypothetical protein
MASSVLGPADSRLLSRKVTPTAPSLPVTSLSDWRTFMPAAAGTCLPSRSTCTVPLTVLI